MQTYIVYLGSHSNGPDAQLSDYKQVENSHFEFLNSLSTRYIYIFFFLLLYHNQQYIYSWKCFFGRKEKAGNKILYLYTKHINGFAAVLEEEEAEELASEKLDFSCTTNIIFTSSMFFLD